MTIQDHASFGCVDGSHPFHLCLDYQSEPDPDVVFYKNTIFTAFCSKWEFHAFLMKLTHIRVLI